MPIMLMVLLESMAPTVSTPSTFRTSLTILSVVSDVSFKVLSFGIWIVAEICGVDMDGIKDSPRISARPEEPTRRTTAAISTIAL